MNEKKLGIYEKNRRSFPWRELLMLLGIPHEDQEQKQEN